VDGLDEDDPNAPAQPRLRRHLTKRETPKRGGTTLVQQDTLILNCNSHQLECVQIICLVHTFLPGTRVTVDLTFRMAKSQTCKSESVCSVSHLSSDPPLLHVLIFLVALLKEYGVQSIEYRTKGKVTMHNVPISVEPKEAVTRLELPMVLSGNILVWVGSSILAGLLLILLIGLILCCVSTSHLYN